MGLTVRLCVVRQFVGAGTPFVSLATCWLMTWMTFWIGIWGFRSRIVVLVWVVANLPWLTVTIVTAVLSFVRGVV